MLDKIIYNGPELARAFGVELARISEMEAMADPLPFFIIPGRHEHLYPLEAVSAWAVRQCKTGQR